MEGRGADVRFPAVGGDSFAALRVAQDCYELLRVLAFSFRHLGPFLRPSLSLTLAQLA